MTAKADAATRRQLYQVALERATGKGAHTAPAGSLELATGRQSWEGARQGECGWIDDRGRYLSHDDPTAQLRACYVRVTVGAVTQGGWTSQGGKPKWVSVGVICPKCGTFWPKPDPLADVK